MGDRTNSTTHIHAKPTEKSPEQVKIEFYKTYDVMTGVRIAVTLGGFFSLMVLLVVYKSKCKSRSISEENIEATMAAAVVEEELAMEKAQDFYNRHIPIHTVPPMVHTRFSSVGGGYNMYTPPLRLRYSPQGRVSLPTSSPYIYPSSIYMPRHIADSPPPKIYREDEDDFDTYRRAHNLLKVPSSRRSSRRLSSVTCSSCDTSYLERRGSAMEMGRPIPPPFITNTRKDKLEEEPWDYYYPIDIQVIQPTPQVSPAGSQISIYECKNRMPCLTVPTRVSPIATLSCKLASFDHDSPSVGSDSVFLDEELVDTEDEVEEFSTDSDAENLECNIPSKSSADDNKTTTSTTTATVETTLNVNRVPKRRFSSPNSASHSYFHDIENDNKDFRSASQLTKGSKISYKSSSDSDTIHVTKPLERHFMSCGKLNPHLTNIPKTSMSASCDHLAKALQEHSSQSDQTLRVVQHSNWSQETLF